MSTLIFSGSSSQTLTNAIAADSHLTLGKAELSIFPNQELRVRLIDTADTAVIVQSLAHPVDRSLMQYCLMADAAGRLGSKRVLGVIPWLGYSKQDKVFRPGEPLSSQVVANILASTNTQAIITLDLHSESISDFFPFPVIDLTAEPVFIEHLKTQNLEDAIVVAPDKGAAERTQHIAKALKLPAALCTKTRDRDSGTVSVTGIDQEVEGKQVYIFDDMIATGDTLVEVSKFLKDKGATSITVCATHHLYVPDTQEKLDKSSIDNLVVTDSIEKPETVSSKKLTVLSVSALLAKAIKAQLSS